MNNKNKQNYTIIINEEYTYINNFLNIIDMTENDLYVEFKDFNIKINGTNIKIIKLMDNEIKFDGQIESISYYYK
ncbi:MAG: hypothetical protein IJZ46_03855 [Bacilli bacterium]|mgnify:CR=1 FL=1|nr:hypothetical protein [Bacilli bacterium]